MFRTAAALVIVLGLAAAPAAAADSVAVDLSSTAVVAASVATAAADSAALTADTDWSLPATRFGSAGRGAILPSLYVTLAALNAYDAFSTRAGIAHGAVESNGVMQGAAKSSPALFAVKAGVTAGTILISEHLWKTHRKGQAIVTMVISNALMSAVAVHNASVLHGIGR